ncbi:U-box domain-containing protein 51 [Linum perenne]
MSAAGGYVRSKSNLDVESVGITAIAVDMGKNSNFAVKWTAENILKKGNSSSCILLHVHNKPAPSHNPNPQNQKEMQQLFLPFRGYFARKGIEAQEVVLFDTDIAKAILEYIAMNSIANIVIGATNKSAFSRKFWSVSISTTLVQTAPQSCSVYVISKGKVQTMRLANQPPPTSKSSTAIPRTTTKQSHLPPPSPESDAVSTSDYSYSQGSLTGDISLDRMSILSGDSLSVSSSTSASRLPTSYGKATPPHPHGKPARLINKTTVFDGHHDTADNLSDFSDSSLVPRSFQSVDVSYDNMDFSAASAASSVSSGSSSDSMQLMEAEIKRLRLELQQTLDAYNTICNDSSAVNKMKMKLQNDPQSHESEQVEDSMLDLEPEFSTPDMELHRNKAARITELLSEMEAHKKQTLEVKARHAATDQRSRNSSKSMESLACYNSAMGNHNIPFKKYSIQDIETSTNYFSQSKKIGEGGYGPVYVGVIDEISVAIKVVRPDLSQGQQQFQKEVEVLSTMRHPHMVTLLGACPQYGCLVYEYMENGSLEDRLYRKDNTPPIPWRTRFKIASEIATGLLFLHESKPEPIVHRDLKPANILLDGNFVSKISDVGLARLVPAAAAGLNRYHMTAAAGTFYYIDPEYQQTGLLSVKSDLFSLGVVLLQLITAKTPMGLSYQVDEAIENGRFEAILDPTVSDWPVEEALSLAKMALQCCELRKRDRPNLRNVLLPELNRLRDFANGGGDHHGAEEMIALACPDDLGADCSSQELGSR